MSTPYPTSDTPRSGGSTDNGMSRPASTSTTGSGGYTGSSGSSGGYTGSSGSSSGSSGGYSGSSDDTLSRVKQTAHDTVDRLADKAGPAIERMKSSMSGMSDSMHARGEHLAEMQEQWMESCRTTVREHPLAAIGIAVVAGMVLSKMLSSSR
jgi:ElaB/YqjD/DUF883 family membrane-anchored ribosome-binding protein